MNNENFHLQIDDEAENFGLSVNEETENFSLSPDENVESFGLSPNNEEEEFTVEFGEVFNDGGTHDYDELYNKPQINGHTLEGDKTGEQLGLQDEINDLDSIRSGAAKGASAVQPHDLARVATTGSYNDLINKPSIPTVNDGTLTIQRNGSTIASFTANSSINRTANISVPTATSQLVNDSGYTTNTGTITSVKMNGNTVATSGEANLGTVITDVSEKQNITDNSLETNNKTVSGAINEVNSIAKGANQALSFPSYPFMINELNIAPSDKYQIGQNVMIVTISVPDLWVSGIENTSSYYTYRGDSAFLSELSENGYVQVGYYKLSALETQKVDLTNYVTNTDYATSTAAGVLKVSNGVIVGSTGYVSCSPRTYTDYSGLSSSYFVSKGTLENVITGKGLVSETDLADYVKNTDYASTSSAGLVKASSGAATDIVSSNGLLYARILDYTTYGSASDNAFIGKGTLENVIEGKGLVSNTDYGSFATAGVIKASSTYGTQFASTGAMYAQTKTYEQYTDSTSPGLFIGKGTLENVITGKGLVDQTALAGKQDTLTAGNGIDITNNVISATGGGGTGNNVFYGTCATGATTAAKVIVCEDFTASDLVAGTRLTVYFTNGNTYNGQATLNVNGTGAKNLYYNGTTTNARYMWVAGESVEFVYNGTQWATVNGGLASTTYYGVTKLATTAGSDSQVFALTPRALFYFANYSIAPYYSASETYAVGDKVRYTYYLYKCITAIDTPEAWTAAHWQQIDTLQEQITSLDQSKVSLSALFDLIYPVGTYYSTNDSNFSPSASFGGTWIPCASAIDQPAYTWRRTA